MEQIIDKAFSIATQPSDTFDKSREWLNRKDVDFEDSGLRVLSYNLTHENNISKTRYWGFEMQKINYANRMKRVLEQIKECNPDIINLQEVQTECHELKAE